MVTTDEIRGRCWDRALEAYGTAYIFEERANRTRIRLRILTFLGIVVPAAIGSLVLSFDDPTWMPVLFVVAGVLGSVQLVGSIWSLAARWEDSYVDALESVSANYRLSGSYQSLGETPPGTLVELQARFELLGVEDRAIRDADYKQGVKEKEKRKGMRAALRQFQRECAGCSRVPKSMEPSDCSICGNF